MLVRKACGADAEVELGQILDLVDDAPAVSRGGGRGDPGAGRRGAELLRDHRDDLIPGEASGHRDQDAGRGIAARVVSGDRVARESRDGFDGAEDPIAERMPPPDQLREEVVNAIVRRVLVVVNLLGDDVLLPLDLDGIEAGPQREVGQDVHGQVQVLFQDPGVQAGHLAPGESVEMPADRLDRERDLEGVAMPGTLEDHVLEEVGHPRLPRRFVTGPDTDPGADRDGADGVHALAEDDDPRRQHGARKAALFGHGRRTGEAHGRGPRGAARNANGGRSLRWAVLDSV